MKGSNSCIYYLSVFTLFLVLQIQGSLALGTLHVDELTPLTQKYVYIPSFGAEHLVSTTTTASDLKGDFSDGFNVNAVGGISFHAQGDNTVSVPGDINYSSPVSGDISFIGATTDIHSQDDVNIWAASEATFSVQNDLTLQSIVGDFRIQSYLDTEVDGLNGVEIGSLYRETTLSAPNGVLELNTDIIAVSAGDVDEYSSPSITISSNNTVDVRATKVFKIDSNAIDFETVEDLTLQSDVHNAEFETLHQFTATASSNIILKTVSNSYFETLLNDFSVATNGVVSLYAHGSFFYASNIALQGSTIHFDSAGNVKFTDTTGTTVTSNSLGFNADSLAQFKTTTGNIDITATQLNTATDNIFFTASHLPTSPIDVNTSGALKFSTRNSNIEFDSTYIELSSGTNANLVAASDVFLIAVKHTNQPNFVSPDGYSSYTASDNLSVNSQTVNLQSNGGIIFRDEASFTFTGVDSLALDAYNLFYLTSTAFVSFNSGNATFTSEKDSTFTADTIEFDFASVNSYAKGKLSVSADASKLSNLNFASTSLSLLSSNDNTYLYGSSLALTISSGLQFENDYEANQEFTVDAAHNLQLTATNNISFKSEASINLMTPTGSIITNANSTQFSGNDGLFETLTGSMFFKDGSFNAVAKNIAIRGRQSITLDASNYNVTMTANTVSVSSGTGVALASSTLDLTASDFANFEADYTLNLNVDNELPFTADKSISVLGGDISFSATDSTFNSGSSFSTSSSKNTLLGVQSTSNITSVLDTTFNFNQISLSTSDYTLTSTGDALFTSTSGDINFSAQSTFSAAVNHTSNFVADNLETNSMGAGFTASIDNLADFTATNAEFTTSNSINLDSAGTFTINGDSFTSTVAAFQFDVGTYDVSGTNTWTSCTGDIVLNAVSYEYTSGNTIPISQQIDPCGTCGTNSSSADQKCAAGNFEIVSRSNRTQTFNTNNVPFVGDVSININGGDLLFQTLTSPGSINFTTDNGVTIKSKNYPNHLTDASDDSLTALAGNLNITITGAAEFVANGYDDNSAYPNYGILMETNYADLYSKNTNYTIKVPTGQIIENAADTIRIATLLPLDNTQATLDPQTPAGFLGQYQDLTVAVTRDVLFDAGVGSITVLSGGSLHQADAKVGAGVEFLAVVGSIDVHADKAQIKFSDKDGFNVTSLYDTVSFTSVLDMAFDSTRQGSTILYQSNFGKMTFNDQLDTSIIAGNPYQDASIAASASDQIYVTSGQSQVYATTGATAAADGAAINIVGEEGGILVEANNNDIDFYSSARVDISAETDTLTFNIQDSILFNADGRIDYRAQTTSSMTVTKGPINFIAGGGGGSVAFASDDGQNIVGQAGKAISISADANGNFDAITGVSYTAQGNINLSNAGVNQDMFYISQGSVNIQADATAGVSFYGKSFHADAFQDVLFDCATFTVDSTSATNTATEPIIEIHAGGDTTVEGLNVFSQGQVQWTTNDGAGVEWLGNKISITVGSDITMTTNGPILLENQGESDDGTFTITSTNGDINIDGEENAVLAGVTSASLNTKGPITYESIGTDPGDGVYIMTRRDLVIDTPEFDMTSDTLDAEINAFSLFASNNIAIENTIGDGGSLSIVSDLSLDLLASGPINMSAQGITTIRSEGDNSDISFEATGNINIQSGGASYFEAQTIYNNAPGTISFATSRGSIDLIASDDTNFIANQTLTFIGKSSLTVSTNDIDSTFLVSSSGDAKFVSVTDFSIESTQGVVSVIGDTLISINNRVPQRSRDQGDIYINSNENIDFESGEDAVYTVGRFYDVTVDTSSYSTNGGDMSFTATYNQANILLTAENSKINIEASSDLSFTVGDSSNTGDLTVSATQDLTWNQLLEDGFGGITISATSSSEPLNIASGDSVSFKAEYSIQGDTKGYLSFKATNAVFASLQSAADVVFQSLEGDVDVQVGDSISYLLNNQNKANEQHLMVIEALASATDSTTQQLYIESRDGTISFLAENNGNIISTSGGYVNYVCADIPEASIECTSGTSVIIESNGVDATNTYGIYFETDDEITFVSTAGLYFNSFHGEAIWNASETFTITSVNFANFESGDDILVYTGYTPAPNAPLDNRIGILFDSSDELLFASYQSDVNFFPRDASWSIDNDIYIRTSGNGGSVSFTSNNNPISATYNSLTMYPTDMLVEAYSLINFDVGGDLLINSGQGMFLYATNIYPSSNDAINFGASNIIFSTPYGHVNFQPDGNGADQHLILPPLISQAGISGSYWRTYYDPDYIRSDFTNTEIETNFPGCEERQFGFDTVTEMFCYCDFNKWRCALSQYLAYQNWLTNYYNDPLNANADPLFL